MVRFAWRLLFTLASVALARASAMRGGLVAVLVCLAPGSAFAAFPDPFYHSSFQPPDTIADWTITTGSWRFADGEFRSSTAPLSIATVHTYDPAQFGHATIGRNFSLDVYAWIASDTANARAGAVFDFVDANNYHEVTISATGTVQLRSRIAGISRTLASATVAAPGANHWIRIALVRSSERTTVSIHGVRAFDNVAQSGLPQGDIGLIARNSHARFDDLDVRNFGRQDPYREDFGDGFANGWTTLSGTWSAASKVYTSTAVVPTAITQGPLARVFDLARATGTPAYTFKVRMLNPYSGSGNLVGIAWVRDAANYTEAVFSPTGRARLNKIANGVRTTLATAAYFGGSRNTWFEVEVGNDGIDPHELAYIKVNGTPVFDVAPNIREGTLSLITHSAPGQFDSVRAAARFLSPVSENFDDGTAPQFAAGGTWSPQNDMLDSTAVVKAGRALVRESAGWHELADIEFRARMRNRFGASGNLVGFTYGARGPVYYEAVFSPTGVAHLRKVVKDVPFPIASAPYEGGGPNQWFDAQLIQRGDRTTVKANGFTVFDNVPQPDAVGGNLGFVAHWTSASVDDVSLAQIPVTRYRFTQLPSLLCPRPSSGVRALNDLGEAVGGSCSKAVLWRNGGVIDLGDNLGSGSAGNDINNQSEIVGDHFNAFGFYWKDGRLQRVFPDCDRSEAHDINERGQIAGICGAGGDGTPAAVQQPDGRVVLLEDLPGGRNWSDAWAINDGGEVVGHSSGAMSAIVEAVSWQSGTVEPLGSEGTSTALDINNRGQIVGITRRDPNPQLAVMWQNRRLIVLPSRPRQIHATAQAINEHGVIVGTTTIETPNPSLGLGGAASHWQEGRVVNLNEVLCRPLPDPFFLTAAMDINERAQIVANAFDFTTLEQLGFLLTPVLGEASCDQ
jgi:uncharacterized membrane protein